MPRYGILMRDINYMSRAFRDEFSREWLGYASDKGG
jgi:hypothetical protein